MSFIDEVRRKRQRLADILKDEEYAGIRRLVEDLYPDTAHFIYELLQNAEDAGATEASFRLDRSRLVLEHDGRPFDERDVHAITNIGRGTKAEDDDKIGRFGIGFKAVFAYSETPHIWSPTFCFRITDLVLPWAIEPAPELASRTRFAFPFNNPKKTARDAFTEVKQALSDLGETTLLFLRRLSSIHCEIGGDVWGEVRRLHHSENQIEVVQRGSNARSKGVHFLRFEQPVSGLEKQSASVAFALDFRPNVKRFDPTKPLASQLKIVPADPGRVAVFFPADKETSGMRFHLHAPFVPELSRASIKETPANLALFEQLASLVAASLHRIRDLGLLTTDFLEVLPNQQDAVAERYAALRDAVQEEMKEHPLTPTQAKSHAPARQLLQGSASLKSLLEDEDLEFLVDYEDEPPRWAAAASQRNSNVDRFLDDLEIEEWNVQALVTVLKTMASVPPADGPPENITADEFKQWLAAKPLEWHQQLYALLQTDYLEAEREWLRDKLATELGRLAIVRLTDGRYGRPGESFFESDGTGDDEVLKYADPRVYSSGKAKAQKENAKKFLERVGVREVGEAERVEAILKRRYSYEAEIPDQEVYRKDLARFIDLVEKEPEAAKIFASYSIFDCGEYWRIPGEVFVDKPFLDTGLTAYYEALGDKAGRAPLSVESYARDGVDFTRLASFAQALGAAARLEVEQVSCYGNPNARELWLYAGGRWSDNGINKDFQIPGLEQILGPGNESLSILIWNTLRGQKDEVWTEARYRKNGNWPTNTAPSQLVGLLRERSWVPQADGRFVRPAEASRQLLPPGFPYDPGWGWLEAIEFGEQIGQSPAEQLAQEDLAKRVGFADTASLKRAQRLAQLLTPEEQEAILAEREARGVSGLPDREPSNPTRRAERVGQQAADAPERISEERTRSVSVGREAVKEEARQYLRHQYTDPEGRMICQICKGRLPFELEDGSDYFEAVELMRDLRKHHKQNYLALCPNHAAMFEHANGSRDEIRDLLLEAADNEVSIVLARRDMTIYFTRTHLADLKTVVRVDEATATGHEDPT